jgi:hypothetical protein
MKGRLKTTSPDRCPNMNEITIHEFASCQAREFPFLATMKLDRLGPPSLKARYDLELTFCGGVERPGQRAVITATGVVCFELRYSNAVLAAVVNVEDISGQQLEEVRYHVLDLEERAFEFSCAALRIERTQK